MDIRAILLHTYTLAQARVSIQLRAGDFQAVELSRRRIQAQRTLSASYVMARGRRKSRGAFKLALLRIRTDGYD